MPEGRGGLVDGGGRTGLVAEGHQHLGQVELGPGQLRWCGALSAWATAVFEATSRLFVAPQTPTYHAQEPRHRRHPPQAWVKPALWAASRGPRAGPSQGGVAGDVAHLDLQGGEA